MSLVPFLMLICIFLVFLVLITLIFDVKRHIIYIYELIDLIAIQSPTSSIFFKEVRKREHLGKILTEQDKNELIMKHVHEKYLGIKKVIKKQIESCTIPEKKHKYETFLKEINDMYPLIMSVDPNSSTEYIGTITDEMIESMKRIIDIEPEL